METLNKTSPIVHPRALFLNVGPFVSPRALFLETGPFVSPGAFFQDQALSFQPARFCCPGQQGPTETIRSSSKLGQPGLARDRPGTKTLFSFSGRSPEGYQGIFLLPVLVAAIHRSYPTARKFRLFVNCLFFYKNLDKGMIDLSRPISVCIFIVSFCVICFCIYLLARKPVVNCTYFRKM